MYDRELVLTILRQIYQAAQTILKRFEPVKTVNDFTDSPLPQYPQVDWKKAIRSFTKYRVGMVDASLS